MIGNKLINWPKQSIIGYKIQKNLFLTIIISFIFH